MSSQHIHEISPQQPDVHVAYDELDEATRQRYEGLDQDLAELSGDTRNQAHAERATGEDAPAQHHTTVVYDELDDKTRQRYEKLDESLERSFLRRGFFSRLLK